MRAGDTVRVHVKIIEKGKTRIQIFEGMVIARKHGNEAGATFTVRKMSGSIGVERIFPLYSPNLEKIEVIKRSVMRRSKLYFIREKVARDIRRKMRNFVQFFASSADLVPTEEVVEETPVVAAEEPVETTPEVAESVESTPEETTEATEETPAE